jgi:hypothetical protein
MSSGIVMDDRSYKQMLELKRKRIQMKEYLKLDMRLKTVFDVGYKDINHFIIFEVQNEFQRTCLLIQSQALAMILLKF